MEYKNQILNKLNDLPLQKWKLTESLLNRREFYYLQHKGAAKIDQVRSVIEKKYIVSIAVDKGSGRIGTAKCTLTDDMDVLMTLDDLVNKAKLSDEKSWSYPEAQEAKSKINLCYQAFLKDFELGAQLLADKFRAAIDKRQTDFNSAELFNSVLSLDYTFSNGLSYKEDRSKIYAECCFSSGQHEEAQEYLVFRTGAHPEQISFDELIEESISSAKALETAKPVKSGKYKVVINAEVFAQLLNDSLEHLKTSQKYYKLPFKEKGDAYLKDYKGIDFKIRSTVHDDYLFGSSIYTGQGSIMKESLLVQDNQILENLSTPQMGQYLERPDEPSLGNICVEVDKGDDINSWNDEEDVLEILQFSGLFSSPRDLSFSSEIRLAKLWTKGSSEPIYVKGGSLNGKVSDNFKGLRLSDKTTTLNLNENSLEYAVGYKGPQFALLTDVTISS